MRSEKDLSKGERGCLNYSLTGVGINKISLLNRSYEVSPMGDTYFPVSSFLNTDSREFINASLNVA